MAVGEDCDGLLKVKMVDNWGWGKCNREDLVQNGSG